jgi:hypothetical protein
MPNSYIEYDVKGPGHLYVAVPTQPAEKEIPPQERVFLEEVANRSTDRTLCRLNKFQLVRINGEIRVEYVCSIPNMKAILRKTNTLPRYIFRVFSDSSAGFNSYGLFKSQAAKEGRHVDVDSVDEHHMARILHRHMIKKKFESHLISFSSSFMWVLHRALSMKEVGGINIRIAIIDTMQIPRGTWVAHAQSLLHGYSVEAKLFFKNMGQAELFVWDYLRVAMDMVKLDDLLKTERGVSGLLDLLPFFRDPEKAKQTSK